MEKGGKNEVFSHLFQAKLQQKSDTVFTMSLLKFICLVFYTA